MTKPVKPTPAERAAFEAGWIYHLGKADDSPKTEEECWCQYHESCVATLEHQLAQSRAKPAQLIGELAVMRQKLQRARKAVAGIGVYIEDHSTLVDGVPLTKSTPILEIIERIHHE